jgi:hypothetical protein
MNNNHISSNDPIKIKPTKTLLKRISDHLETDGFYCLKHSVDKKILKKFQVEVKLLVKKQGNRYFSLINPYKDPSSEFNLLDSSNNLKRYLSDLANIALKKNTSDQDILNVLRVVAGENTNNQSFKFHYDATVVTILIPLIIPRGDRGSCGHLVAFKNFRNIRGNVLINIVEKVIIQNPLTQKIISFFIANKNDKFICELKEGNIYFFTGYRTLHANQPVNPKYLRATLLFHCGNPHNNSPLLKMIARARHWREMLNFEARSRPKG